VVRSVDLETTARKKEREGVKHMVRTKWTWLMLLLVAVMALTIVPLAGAQAPKTDVIITTQQEPARLDPLSNAGNMFVASMVRFTIFVGDVYFDNKWKVHPWGVEKLPSLKDGDWKIRPDGKMEVRWRLKKGLLWHDGKPVTAYDWIFAYRVNIHPEFPATTREIAERIENVSAPDPYTVVTVWKKKDFRGNLFLSNDGGFPLPMHVLDRDFRRNPSKFDQIPWSNAVPTIGNGPYVLKEWRKGSHIVVEAFDKWPFEKPTIKRITFRFISDTNTIIANVLAGATDATDETAIPFAQGLELEKRLKAEGRKDIIAEATPGLIWEHIDLNLDNPHLKDKRVRQALLYAANREAIVQSLFEGKQPVSHSFLPEKHWGYNPRVKKYNYDPERAKRLLAEAGYRPGPDGILVKDGVGRLSLTITTTAGNRVREAVEQILQQQWRQVGIELKISNQPARVYFGDTLPQRKYDLGMFAWVLSPISILVDIYQSKEIPSPANNFAGANFPGYRNEELDRIVPTIGEELDERKRTQLLQKVQEILVEDLPALPLYVRSDYTTHKAALGPWLPTGITTPVTWNAVQWKWSRM